MKTAVPSLRHRQVHARLMQSGGRKSAHEHSDGGITRGVALVGALGRLRIGLDGWNGRRR
jgi:hypothetical protein